MGELAGSENEHGGLGRKTGEHGGSGGRKGESGVRERGRENTGVREACRENTIGFGREDAAVQETRRVRSQPQFSQLHPWSPP